MTYLNLPYHGVAENSLLSELLFQEIIRELVAQLVHVAEDLPAVRLVHFGTLEIEW